MIARALGLDTAKSATGWAVVEDGRVVDTGVLRCPVKRPKDAFHIDAVYSGAVINWYMAAIDALLVREAPGLVAIEAPPVFGRDHRMGAQTIHLIHAVAGTAAGACVRRSVPAVFVAQQTWRSGVGVRSPKKADRKTPGFSGTAWNKAEARRVCAGLGVIPGTDDAAEAACIAWWAWLRESSAPALDLLSDLDDAAASSE